MIPSAIQSALDASGIQAERIELLWWVMFWVCAAVYVAVMIALAMAVRRGVAARATEISPATLARGVSLAVGAATVALVGLLVASAMTGRAIASLAAPDPLAIQITAKQWWWEIEYQHPTPSMRAITANELHLPAGRPVLITLKASDVIHSFWVPNLHGKMDLIPGRANYLWLRADRRGVFRGQCAEYCGLQHARMSLTVTVEDNDTFEQWWAAQREPARPPVTDEQKRGLEIMERGVCAMCHRVAGTAAGAKFGPDLTHFATRSTIGAGTVPNRRDHLAKWLDDPQDLKPDNKMPSPKLSAADLQAVLAYMETLR